MRYKKTIYLIMIMIVLCFLTQTGSAMPTVGIEPTSLEISHGDNFTVNITVDPDGTEILGVQYRLSFDNNFLNVIDQSKGTFLSQDGTSTINIPNKINNSIGEVEYGETRPVSYGVTNYGVLAVITFNTTDSGACNLILDNVILSNVSAGAIPGVEVNEGICDIVIIEQKSTSSPTETEIKSLKKTKTSKPAPETAMTSNLTNTNQTSGWIEPQTTETASSISTPNQSYPSEEKTEQSGYSLIFVTMGLIIFFYIILKKE